MSELVENKIQAILTSSRREWKYWLPYEPDKVLEKRVADWADRRQFAIVTWFGYKKSEGFHVTAEIDTAGAKLGEIDRAYTGLRRIVHRWIQQHNKPPVKKTFNHYHRDDQIAD